MIPVVFSTDHNFIMPTYIAAFSMLANSSRKCKIYLLIADDVTDGDKDMLSQLVSKYNSTVEFISVGNVFDDTFVIRGITKATYFRLLIPWIIPNEDKVIYLDGDIVVVGDIAELYDCPVDDNNLICGVRTPGYSTDRGLKKRILKNGLDYSQYINAGILLFNCRRLREENFKPIFMSHIDKQYYFQDQDILNITCKNRIGHLPLKFNYSGIIKPKIKAQLLSSGLMTVDDINDAECAPVIIHYAGPKPWKEFTRRWNDWVEYYKKSPFYNQTLLEDVSSNVLFPKFNLKKTIKSILR